MNEKKVEKPLVQENAPTNGGGGTFPTSGSGVNNKVEKPKKKINKGLIIAAVFVIAFILAVILL